MGKFWQMVTDREAWCVVDHGVAESDTSEKMNNNYSQFFLSLSEVNFTSHELTVLFIFIFFGCTAQHVGP